MKKIGAPPGGKCHWFIFELDRKIKNIYDIKFDYDYDNYFLQRPAIANLGKIKAKIFDEFIIIRTSRHCFRIMYFNHEYKVFEYASANSPRKAARKVYQIFRKNYIAEYKALQEEKIKEIIKTGTFYDVSECPF